MPEQKNNVHLKDRRKTVIFKDSSFIFRVGAIIIAAILFVTGCRTDKAANAVAKLPEHTSVQVRPVTHVMGNMTVTVSGALVADKTAPLGFLVPGKVDRVTVEEGDRVSKGMVLATVDARDYRDRLAMAEAAVVRAKDAVERYEPLYREGAFTEKNLIELKTGLAEAVAARNIAKKALADTELTSPIPGIVGSKSVEVGQMVSPQAPAFTIVKTDVIYARVAVPESEIGRIVMGKSADVSVSAFEGRTFTGRVSMIGAVADERTRTYAVKIELSNPGGLLRPGMIVQAGIRTDKTVDMLTVPGSAIVRDADNLTYVFVTDAKRTAAVRKRVTPGDALRNEIEIRSGLDPEDTVIVSGQNKLSDGALIIITAEPAPSRTANEDA